jgi:hypothetical protein
MKVCVLVFSGLGKRPSDEKIESIGRSRLLLALNLSARAGGRDWAKV